MYVSVCRIRFLTAPQNREGYELHGVGIASGYGSGESVWQFDANLCTF